MPDNRRRAEPDYRAGWNAYQTPIAPPPDQVTTAANADCDIVNPAPGAFNSYAASPIVIEQARECREKRDQARMVMAQQAQAAANAKLEADEAQRESDARIAAFKAVAERDAKEAAAKAAQLAAEESPDNLCRDKEMAGRVIDGANEIIPDKTYKIVDIEHLTTSSVDPVHSEIACHGVFVFENGFRKTATVEFRMNVAGRMLTSWRPD